MKILAKEDYFSYLINIKKKLKLYNELLSEGEGIYASEIALKLRTLFTNTNVIRNKDGKKVTKPLITILQEFYDFEFLVGNNEFKDFPDSIKAMFRRENSPIEFFLQIQPNFWFSEKLKKNDIVKSFNGKKMVFLDGKYYSQRGILQIVCNKMEGAHIDEEIPLPPTLIVNAPFIMGQIAKQTIKAIEMIEDFVLNGTENAFIKSTKGKVPDKKNE